MVQTELSSAEFERRILEEAIHSPAVAMMRLSIEIDRQLRVILAVIGRLKEYSGTSPTEAVDLILTTGGTAAGTLQLKELRDTIASFWELRNELVHGRSREVLAMRAVDYGLRILRIISSIPRPAFIVETMVPLFADKECRRLREDVRGVILSARSPTEKGTPQIHPTRKNYHQGESLSWEWDYNGPGWGETWYRDPDSSDIKFAWSESLEFIGRPLDQI